MKKILIGIGLLACVVWPLKAGAESADELVQEHLKKKLREGTYFLLGIDKRLRDSRQELEFFKSNIPLLESKVNETEKTISKLSQQLDNLDRLIRSNEEKILAGKLQKARMENEISKLKTNSVRLSAALDEQKEVFSQTLTAYYLQTNALFLPDGSAELLPFLGTGQSTGEVLKTNDYLLFMKEANQKLFRDIFEAQEKFEANQKLLREKQESAEDLQSLLERVAQTLEQVRSSRVRLIAETQGKQNAYETLLEASRKEEAQAEESIERLRENFEFFDEKLKTLKAKLPPGSFDDSLNLEGSKTPALPPAVSEKTFDWPVSPLLGISAYFHDEDYEKALGLRHNAIDIRLPQGSKVKTASDGIVSKVSDNGFAYSYIIIAHPDKMLTLYGHMSEILVSEGEIVRQGQVIGLSGGIPGTKGAGWLTTGAHLHFEVFKNFAHVDPLEYLPLDYLPLASLPEKYLEKLTKERVKIKRE